MSLVTEFLVVVWDTWLEMAPWLILGLLAAGLLKAWLPADLLSRWLGRPGIGSVTRAAVVGTPLPLCSCSVLPAAIQLHRGGASKGATVSFLVSTPVNGADSLSLSWALLGPFMMAARLVSALVAAVAAGTLAERLARPTAAATADAPPAPATTCGCASEPAVAASADCCAAAATSTPSEEEPSFRAAADATCCSTAAATTPAASDPVAGTDEDCCGAPVPAAGRSRTARGSSAVSEGTSCCGDDLPAPVAGPAATCCSTAASQPKPGSGSAGRDGLPALVAGPDASCCGPSEAAAPAAASCCHEEEPRPAGWWGSLKQGVGYAATRLLDDIVVWLVVGVVLAAAIRVLAPPTLLATWGSGLPAMLGMLAVGVPMYICATASTPVAAAMIAAGMSPGTVLVFLLAGPATNLGAVAVVRKELGTRVTAGYLATLAAVAVVSGLVTDALVRLWRLDVVAQAAAEQHLIPHAVMLASGVLLIALALRRPLVALRRRRRPQQAALPQRSEAPAELVTLS